MLSEVFNLYASSTEGNNFFKAWKQSNAKKKKTDEEGGVHGKNLIAVNISLAAENRELTGICC